MFNKEKGLYNTVDLNGSSVIALKQQSSVSLSQHLRYL